MKDQFNKIKGHFKLECLDKNNNIIDGYEEDNLIMDSARFNMAAIIAGISAGTHINKFVLGTEGYNGSLIVPKDATTGFVSTRANLFSEADSAFTYPIQFAPVDAMDANATIVYEADTGSIVNVSIVNSTITYFITIPIAAANGTGTVAYTEAALYAGSNIFSMKTFGAKVKDNSVQLRITWSISF
jgi:hypothetical protein